MSGSDRKEERRRWELNPLICRLRIDCSTTELLRPLLIIKDLLSWVLPPQTLRQLETILRHSASYPCTFVIVALSLCYRKPLSSQILADMNRPKMNSAPSSKPATNSVRATASGDAKSVSLATQKALAKPSELKPELCCEAAAIAEWPALWSVWNEVNANPSLLFSINCFKDRASQFSTGVLYAVRFGLKASTRVTSIRATSSTCTSGSTASCANGILILCCFAQASNISARQGEEVFFNARSNHDGNTQRYKLDLWSGCECLPDQLDNSLCCAVGFVGDGRVRFRQWPTCNS